MQVSAFKLVLLVFLLQDLKIPLNLFLLCHVQLFLHLCEGLSLSLLSDLSLKAFMLNSLFKHGDSILVVGFDSIHHHVFLSLLSLLSLSELLLLSK